MKKIWKALLFCLTALLITGVLSFLMIPSSYLRVVLHEVQNDKGNFDMAFFGQSLGETCIDPYTIEEETGIRSYNLCRRIVTIPDMLYLVKEANYKNDLKTVVVDIDPTYWHGTKIDYYNDAYILPHLNNPKNKIEYFFRYSFQADYRVSFCRYVVHGFGDIKKIQERVAQKTSDDYRNYSMKAVSESGNHFRYVGRGFRYGQKYAEAQPPKVEWNRDAVSHEVLESFEELTIYCRQNDIQLICIQSPLPHERFSKEQHADMNDYYTELCKKYQVPYFNFNYINDSYLTWNQKSFEDHEGHMMGPFAQEYSAVMGHVLSDYQNHKDCSCYFSDTLNTTAKPDHSVKPAPDKDL